MSAFFRYASFPNSRIKPRPATSQGLTSQVPILEYTQPLTEVTEPNANRTYIIFENFSSSTALWYTYALTLAVNPSVVPTFGVDDAKAYDSVGNQLYRKNGSGLDTNWVPVNIQDVGEKILPLQTATLESQESIYAAADSAVPVVPQVVIGLDEGVG